MNLPNFLLRRTKVEQIQKGYKSDDESRNIFISLKFFMVFSQVLGLLPQENIRRNLEDMRFKWLSFKMLYTIALICSLAVAVFSCLIYWATNGCSIDDIAIAVSYGGSLASMILYLQLAKSWEKLMRSWHSIDLTMNTNYGYPEMLDRKIKLFMAMFIFLGILDYMLCAGNLYEHLTNQYGKNLTTQVYYNTSFPQLFAYVPYTYFTAIFCSIITVHSNLTWAFNDLFIIILSTALALRFQQISQRLNKERFKINPLSFWRSIREDYDRLASFCKELDSHISSIVLLSYFLNIFFLLIQLYHSLEPISLIVRKIYCIFSFGYLILKTSSVSLYAAWINDESKAPTNVLNSVDSSLYNVEIRRLLVQISFDKTALTGCKMFSVKRGIILSVASAIVTYELVLIQFSEANLYENTP
ncbi:gustatory receptor for sugar taste 64e-like isoform X1 [Sitophilus oryzae]|uniref:Gustatory receptor n=1 Tax=Sitophilus oryzae TaxID=7048 RepID=A0A6J2YDK2_SITOR|nr:gustatory receptor for sugar taste 64e-like isoform X1 [Sitophilus oryzae]